MAEQKVPNIAEKVRFWEEQDKINQALIPRVLELHDAVSDLHGQTARIPEQLATLQARVVNSAVIQDLQTAVRDLNERIGDVPKEIAAAETRIMNTANLPEIRAALSELRDSASTIPTQIAAAEARGTELLQARLRGLRSAVYVVGALSLLAIALSIYSLLT